MNMTPKTNEKLQSEAELKLKGGWMLGYII